MAQTTPRYTTRMSPFAILVHLFYACPPRSSICGHQPHQSPFRWTRLQCTGICGRHSSYHPQCPSHDQTIEIHWGKSCQLRILFPISPSVSASLPIRMLNQNLPMVLQSRLTERRSILVALFINTTISMVKFISIRNRLLFCSSSPFQFLLEKSTLSFQVQTQCLWCCHTVQTRSWRRNHTTSRFCSL